MLYLITFWHKDYEDSSALHEAIKNIADDWWRYLPATWIIESKKSSEELSKKLEEHKSLAKFLLITRVSLNDVNGWLPKEAWTWIEEHKRKK